MIKKRPITANNKPYKSLTKLTENGLRLQLLKHIRTNSPHQSKVIPRLERKVKGKAYQKEQIHRLLYKMYTQKGMYLSNFNKTQLYVPHQDQLMSVVPIHQNTKIRKWKQCLTELWDHKAKKTQPDIQTFFTHTKHPIKSGIYARLTNVLIPPSHQF